MHIIQQLIYRLQAKKYGDPRVVMEWINGNNRFFLKDGYTIDQVNQEQDRKKRKAMIDYSWKRWREWVHLQRREAKWRAWWQVTHCGPFHIILSKVLREPDSHERKMIIFRKVMSREEFERFLQRK